MYKEMRLNKRQKTEAEAWEYLNRAEWGVLSLCADGLPYGVPVSHAVCGKTLYFHCALEGQKLDFIQANPTGCFTAVPFAKTVRAERTMSYESVMVFGKLRAVQDEAEKLAAFDAINLKFTDDLAESRAIAEKALGHTGIVAMEIERITAKGSRKED